MFTFTPRTDEELNAYNLVPPGKYDFQIINAEDSISKNGNPMMKLMLKIWDTNGAEKIIHDYLVTNIQTMEYKIKHFCSSIGAEKEYESGKLDCISLIGKTGILETYIQKDKEGKYQNKNSVKDYVKKIEIDEDLPF